MSEIRKELINYFKRKVKSVDLAIIWKNRILTFAINYMLSKGVDKAIDFCVFAVDFWNNINEQIPIIEVIKNPNIV